MDKILLFKATRRKHDLQWKGKQEEVTEAMGDVLMP